MILTIPYNPKLPCGYDKLVSAITRNGKHPNHTLFVAAAPEHEDGAFEISMKLRDYFGRQFAVTVEQPVHPESAVRASNRVFLTVLQALREYAPMDTEMPEPVMLYFDPTWKPFKQRWLDEFQSEYYISGAPLTFGNFDKENGKVVGPVAISRKWLTTSKLLEFLPENIYHWREFLAWEIINKGLQSEAFGRTLPAYIRPIDP